MWSVYTKYFNTDVSLDSPVMKMASQDRFSRDQDSWTGLSDHPAVLIVYLTITKCNIPILMHSLKETL